MNQQVKLSSVNRSTGLECLISFSVGQAAILARWSLDCSRRFQKTSFSWRARNDLHYNWCFVNFWVQVNRCADCIKNSAGDGKNRRNSSKGSLEWLRRNYHLLLHYLDTDCCNELQSSLDVGFAGPAQFLDRDTSREARYARIGAEIVQASMVRTRWAETRSSRSENDWSVSR